MAVGLRRLYLTTIRGELISLARDPWFAGPVTEAMPPSPDLHFELHPHPALRNPKMIQRSAAMLARQRDQDFGPPNHWILTSR
jgi:hypothetical protein